jgi:hypothetical protein
VVDVCDDAKIADAGFGHRKAWAVWQGALSPSAPQCLTMER